MRRLLNPMFIFAGLAGVLLQALPGAGQVPSPRTGISPLSTQRGQLPTPRAISPYLQLYQNLEGTYYIWMNPITFAAIGFQPETYGSFGFGTTKGDPAQIYDNNLVYINRTMAFLYIDGYGGEEIQVGKEGTMVQQPTVDINTQSASFKWHTDSEEYRVSVEFKMWMVRDVLKYQYKITNLSVNTLRIGFHTMHDLIWGYDADGNPITVGPYYVPGSDEQWVIHHYKDDKVPDKWFIRETLRSEEPPALRISQPLTVQEGVTRPSHLIIAPTGDISAYGWQEILEEALPENANQPPAIEDGWPFTIDDVIDVGLYYPIQSLPFGQTRTVDGEFRLDWSTVKTMGYQYALAAVAPEYLNYSSGDNPDTPEEENGYLNPPTFTVDAYLYNATRLMEPAASLSINLGPGLVLAPPIQVQPMNTVEGVVTDHKYQWTVCADGTASGVIPITITAFLNPGGSITTTRYINVPALPSLSRINLQPANHFTGFPFAFSNPDAMAVLSDVSDAVGPGFAVAWWDPTMPGYRYARPDSLDQLNLQAGHGYWLKIPDTAPNLTTSIPLIGATPVNQTRSYSVRLDRGWNAISNPFQFSIIWGYCYIVYHNVQYTISDAIKHGLIRREMWIWDVTNQEYLPPYNPYPRTDLFAELKPFEGYWLYATEGMYLVYMPNQFLPPMGGRPLVSPTSLRTPGSPNQWQVTVLASTNKGKARSTFGVSPLDQDGLSDGDMMAPPIGPSGLAVYFPHRNWGVSSSNYASDIQAPAATKSWVLEVQCDQPNQQVVLRWPDLTQVPPKTPLILTDELTGRSVAMRTSPSYSFNSGQGGIRRFTITVGGVSQNLRITSTQVQRTTRNAGAIISCGLTVPAQVTLRIRTTSGRLIRTLGPTEVSGQGTISWDGRDDHDRVLPAGVYLGELYAEASDGQRIRAIVTISTRN